MRACLRITSYRNNDVISDKHNMHNKVGFMWWCMLVSMRFKKKTCKNININKIMNEKYG